jgi:hypothetical protein
MNGQKTDKKRPAPECINCSRYTECRETAASWFLLFISLIATITIRLVNVVMDFSQLWAKIFWYMGVSGFFIFFLYKFRLDRSTQRQIDRMNLLDRLTDKEQLSVHEYDFLRGILCQLRSKKDTINYFFIFFTSGLALLLGIYQDFLKK